MSIVEWSDEYRIGVDEIDGHHKTLVGLINKIGDELVKSPNSGQIAIMNASEDLREYVIHHFSTEENYMLKFNFDGYEKHKEEHNKFDEMVLDLENKIYEGKKLPTIELVRYLLEWFVRHIMAVDRQYVEVFKKNNL